MNFCSCGFIFILFLNILAPKVQKTVDYLPSFEIFAVGAIIQLEWLNFKLIFGQEFPKPARVHCTAEEEELEAEGDDPLYIFPPVPRPSTALWPVLRIIVPKIKLKI